MSSRSYRLLLPAAALSLTALNDCGPVEPGTNPLGGDITCGSATFNLEGRTYATFGTSADARKINAFLQATIDLDRAVDEVHDGTLDACRAIGRDLGIPESEYVAMGSEPMVATVCRRVIREVRDVIRAGLPASATLQVVATPPVCRVDLNVAAQCHAQCTASATVMVPRCRGTVVADCSGSCDATCTGSCSGGCTGQCSGTCTGQCMGTCTGQCTGTCPQMDGTGRCIGTCMGTCMGSCSANCMGSCSGTCSAGCSGTCMGQCRGMCTVASNVRCEGMWEAMVDAQCDAACRAQVNARAECSPAQVAFAASAMVNPAGRDRLNLLLMSLQRNYPAIVRNGERARVLLTQTVPTFAQSIQGAAQAAGRVSASAAACIVRAGAAAADVGTRFNASVQVTVEFSAAVTVQGG